MKANQFALTLFFMHFGLVLANADNSDDQLDAAYKQALASKKLDPASLQWIELNWIPFRDAEGELSAWIAGKSRPDEKARKATRAQSTKARLAELEHIAATGRCPDLTTEESGAGDAVEEVYTSLREQVIGRGNPKITGALIVDQKAWRHFANLQSDYGADSNVRLNALRILQLRADAAALGLNLTTTPSWDPDKTQTDYYTEVSPDYLIRIELVDQGEAPKAWVISNTTGDRKMLPIDKDEMNTGRGKPTVVESDYAISPDNRWIFRTQKFYHGMCGAYLYERVSGLEYGVSTSEPLDMLAWKFFKKATKLGNVDVSQGGVVKFVSWGPGRLRISLNARKQLTFADVNDWRVDYDLKTKTFSIPAELKEHDR